MHYKIYKIKFQLFKFLFRIINLRQYIQSLKIRKELKIHNNKKLLSNLKINGYLKLNNSMILPKNIINNCNEIIQNYKKNPDEYITNKNKSMIYNILPSSKITKIDGLIEFATDKKILSIVSDYLNDVPLLLGIYLFRSPKSFETDFTSSQLFHIDNEQNKQIKVFYLLHDTDESHGPLEYIGISQSREFMNKIFYNGKRINDEKFKQIIVKSNFKKENKFIGREGSGLMIDTSNCLHRGSRKIKNDRYVLQFQYFSKFSTHRNYKEKMNLNLAKYSDLAKFVLN